jgi:hypothetical protein
MLVDATYRTVQGTADGEGRADLTLAVDVVTAALAALRDDSGADAVDRALGQATATVDALGAGVTTVVLRRLIASIADCHRDGVRHSPRLAVCRRSTLVALRLDPRWVPSTRWSSSAPVPQR